MFRPMRRHKQQLSEEECRSVLETEKRGVLSVLGDDGYPYGVPLNHWYCSQDGRLYFHGSKSGHKLDAISRCDKASFCVLDQGFCNPGEWALNVRSVIVFGRIALVNDHAHALEISRQLSLKFTTDLGYIEHEIQRSGPSVLCFALIPEYISGKLVNES